MQAQDVPGQVPAGASLRASEEQLRRLIFSANDAVIMMDKAGLVVNWNPSAESMFGWSAAEAMGRRLSDLIVPQALRDQHEDGVQRYVETRQARLLGKTVEVDALRRDGGELPVELSLWPLESAGELLFGAFVRDVSARRAAERTLREQERKYRAVVEHGTEGIIVVSGGVIVFANAAAARLIGVTADALEGAAFTHWIHPDDRPLVVERHVRRLRGEEVDQQYPFRVVRADGEVLWLEVSAVAMEWEGRPATLSFLTDISERRRLEDTLNRSLIERDTILENSIVGIAFLDTDRHMRWANSALCEMLRLPSGSATGLPTMPFFASREAYDAAGVAFAEAARAGRGVEVEIRMRRADGEPFWAYASGRALAGGDLLPGFVWALIDITRRKELEQALQRKTDEQEAILDSTLIGIGLVSERRFRWVNGTLTRMFGYDAGQLIGAEPRVLFPEDAAWQSFLEPVQRTLDERGSYSGEHLLFRSDGQPIWVRLQGTRLQSREGPLSSLWTFVDVSEGKRAEEDIRRALEREKELSQLKSRFVSMTSHEFRTPLAGILSSVDLLGHYGDRIEAEEKTEILEQIRASVERMTRMLNNILLVGRAESKGLQFRPQPIDLGALCRELADEVTHSLAAGGARPALRVQASGLDGEKPVLDPTLLRHILGNLLSNAFKYSPSGGEVSFEVELSPAQARFVVSDQGIGIPGEDQVRLFESFHRASNVGGIAGTGLGLAIVKQCVDLHGGRIDVESGPGRGSRFTVTIPTGSAQVAP